MFSATNTISHVPVEGDILRYVYLVTTGPETSSSFIFFMWISIHVSQEIFRWSRVNFGNRKNAYFLGNLARRRRKNWGNHKEFDEFPRKYDRFQKNFGSGIFGQKKSWNQKQKNRMCFPKCPRKFLKFPACGGPNPKISYASSISRNFLGPPENFLRMWIEIHIKKYSFKCHPQNNSLR